MRRSVFGLSLVTAAAGLLLLTSCVQQDNVLSVLSINDGNPIYCDIVDWSSYVDNSDPENPEIIYVPGSGGDVAEFEFQYVEVGAGLPTLSKYQANLTKYTIDYTRIVGEEIPEGYAQLSVPMTLVVPSDPNGEKTRKVNLYVTNTWWKAKYFEADDDNPYESSQGVVAILDASIVFSAYDSLSGRTFTATGQAQLQFADFWDDPDRFGQ